MLYQPTAKLSLGAVYRTGTTMDMEGKARFGNTLFRQREKSRFAQEIIIPATYGIGLTYRIRPGWLVGFDWHGSDWSRMRVKTNFKRQGKGLVNQQKDLHWKRSNRFRLGTEYRLSKKWRLQGGYFYGSPSLPEEVVSVTSNIDTHLHSAYIGASYEQGNWSVDMTAGYRTGNRDKGRDKFHFDAPLSTWPLAGSFKAINRTSVPLDTIS